MDCPICRKELMVDRVTENQTWLVCLNPKCPKYRISFNDDNEETEALIQPKQTQESV